MKHVWRSVVVTAAFCLAAVCSIAGEEHPAGAPVAGEEGVFFNVYELFGLEDDAEFEKRLNEIPAPFLWMDKEAIRYKRGEYLARYREIINKYAACRAPGAAESLPKVLAGMGDPELAFLYGVCRRAERGPAGCGVIQSAFPEYYKKCVAHGGQFWFNVVPFLAKEKISESEYLEFGKKFCSENPGAASDYLKKDCPRGIAGMLKPLRVVVFDRDPGKCGKLPAGVGRDFCKAVFADDRKFCRKKGKKFPLGCMGPAMFGALAAVARSDAGLLPKDENASFHNIMANYFIRKNKGGASYCDSFFRQEIIPACGKLEKEEIDSIAVYYP